FSVDGRMLIEDVNDLTGVTIVHDKVDSIGGWLFKELDGAPTVGKVIRIENLLFEVAEAEPLRIMRVNIKQLEDQDGTQESAADSTDAESKEKSQEYEPGV